MTTADVIRCEGLVVDEAHGTFRIEVELGGRKHVALAKPSGRMNMSRVRVLPGDVVTLELSPYDLKRGRIVYRGPMTKHA